MIQFFGRALTFFLLLWICLLIHNSILYFCLLLTALSPTRTHLTSTWRGCSVPSILWKRFWNFENLFKDWGFSFASWHTFAFICICNCSIPSICWKSKIYHSNYSIKDNFKPCLLTFDIQHQNIARGTTDPGYWVYNLNHVSDWNKFEIILAEKDHSSYGLNTLGPLCLWQCLSCTP